MLLPRPVLELLQFCEMHSPVWTANAAAIGLSPAQATAFATATTAARAAHTAQQNAIEAARVATAAAKDAVLGLRRLAGDDIRTIRAFAEQQAKPLVVYNLAQIPAPAAPAPLPPPGTPFDFTAGLNTDGSVTLRWKCTNPVGSGAVVYNIRRKVGDSTTYTLIGAVGERRFDDATIPFGAGRVEYVITAQRGQATGNPSSPFTIMFGVEGPGLSIASQFEGKIAA